MRKVKLFFTMLMLIAFSVGNVWGAETVYKTALFGSSYNSKGVSNYTGVSFSSTNDGFTVDVVNANNNNNGWSFIKIGGKKGAYTGSITTNAAIDKAITKVDLTIDAITANNVTSITLKTSSDGSSWSDAGTYTKETGTKTVTLSSPTSNLYYKIEAVCTQGSSNGLLTISKVEYYAEGGTPNPTVTADPEEVTDVVAAGVANQTIDLTYENIENYETEVSVHPNADGTGTLSPAWLSASVSDADDYATVTYSVAANTEGARTAYIKVYTTDGDKEATTIIPVSQVKYSAPTGTFELFSGDLEEGDYVFVVDAKAMTNSVSSSRLTNTNVTIAANQIENPDESIIWHVAASGDYWTIYSAAVEKYAASTGVANKAQMLADGTDDQAKWSVAKTGNAFNFQNKANADGSVNAKLQRNGDYGWACYSAYSNISLYKKQVAGQPKAPTFSVEGGNYESAQSVELSCKTEGATIYYTTNGDAPTSSSTQYNGTAIAVDHTMTIKAIAIKNDIPSTVASATYTIIVWQTVADVWDDIVVGGPKNAHVYGYVSQTEVGGYDNNFYISDNGSTEGNQLYAYRMNMNSFSVAVGDKVKLAGDLTNYQGTKEFEYANQGATQGIVVALEAKGAVTSVAVSGTATKTTYSANETFETAGLKVTATYANGFSEVVTEGITWGDDLTDHKVAATGTVQVTATVGGVISAAYGVAIEVSTKALVSIALSADEFEVYQGLELPKPTVTATYSEGDPEDVTALAEFTGYNKNTPGEQTITVSYSFGGGDPIEETYTVTVKPIYNVELPASVAKGLIETAVGETESTEDMIVRGIVSHINNASNNVQTYWISDDGTRTNEVEIFKGKYLSGANFTTTNQLKVGDEVVVKGKVVYYNSTTPEFANGKSQLQSLARTPNFEVEAVTGFEVGTADLAVADLTITQDGEGEVTLASSDKEEFVTIEGGKLHAVAPGTATITANLDADGIYKAATYEFSVTVIPAQVKYAITFASNGADGGSDPEAIENKAAGAEVTLPANTWTKTGFTFTGWKVFNNSTSEEVEVVAGAFEMPASAVTLQAQWAEIPVWAYTYSSNLKLKGNSGTKSYAEKVKITVNEVLTEFDALRACTGSAAGSCTIKVPAGTQTLHFHAAAWNAKTSTITVTMGETELLVQALDADAGIKNSSPYTLEGIPYEYYYSIDLSSYSLTEETTITFSAGSDKRFVLFGVNQEGGVVPVLDHIEIAGDLTTKSGYKAGDAIDMDGLTVNAIYTLGGTPQTPVDITDETDLEWSYDPLVEGQENVTITATYKGQTDDIEITLDEPVASADPVIYVQPSLTVNFGTVAKDASVGSKQITVTLQNVAAATATLGGTNPEAFNIDDTEIADGDVITISVVSTATLGSYSATITITDNAGLASQKVVNLSLSVEAVETPVSTSSQWVAATAADLVDGAEVLITGVKGEVTYAMGVDRGNNRAAVAGTLDGDVFTPGANTMSFILVAQEEGKFALRASNGKYLYAAHSSSNYLKTRAAIEDGNAKWTLTATSAIANGSNTNETIRFNGSNNPEIFSCYADETKQLAIAFYVPKVVEPVYETVREELAPNAYYTMCLEKAVTDVRGGSIWRVVSKAENGTDVILEDVDGTLDAGRPYIFFATADKLEVVYEGAAVGAPITTGNNGLIGSFTQQPIAQAATNYIIYNNALYFVNSANVYVGAHRAYLDMTGVPAYQNSSAPAPGRRRISMAVHGEQVATGMESIQPSEISNQKVLINGQLFILRGEKMYDATGRLVK